MTLTSYQFLLFLPAVLALTLLCPAKLRSFWLLLASYYFYWLFKPVYLLVLLFVTGAAYACGIVLEKRREKKILVLGILLTVGLLILFKYVDFLWNLTGAVLGAGGLHFPNLPFSLIQPIGISYFTFQIIAYLVDIYRGKIAAERNWVHFALFIAFFPKIISGPVERANPFLLQIQKYSEYKLWNWERIAQGLQRMVWGFFQKLVVADRIGFFVNAVFDNFQQYGTVELFLAGILYMLQLYADFDGYVNIALGASKVLGFELTENFAAPFFAGSISEFWGRWHISLSSWLRDYIYIPLGGNRKGKARKCLNILITFLVSGIWHGAGLNFVFWGLLHGLLQVVESLLQNPVDRINARLQTRTWSFGYRLMRKVKCFLLVSFAFIFFRAPSLSIGVRYCYRMFTRWNPWTLFDGSLYTLGVDEKYARVIFFGLVLMLLVDLIRYRKNIELPLWLSTQCIWFRYGFVLMLLIGVIVFGAYGPSYSAENFIYFQF